MTELLIAKKKQGKMRFKVVKQEHNRWSPSRYEKTLASTDFNQLAFLLYDLYQMGYPIEKAYLKFKQLLNEPDLFFLK